MVWHVRRRIRFELLRSCLISMCGHKGGIYNKFKPVDQIDLNLVEE